MPNLPWIPVDDFNQPSGWARPEVGQDRARAYCEMLERGEILFFSEPPFELSAEDRQFLLAQEWSELRMHKNVSYRPGGDSCEVFPAVPQPSAVAGILGRLFGGSDRVSGEISCAIRR